MPTTHNAENPHPDKTVYQSEDGLVEVRIKTNSARRWPQHGYPVACLIFKAAKATRVQLAPDGRIDVMLNNREIKAFFDALKYCDPAFDQTVKGPAQNKCPLRKKKWEVINRNRYKKS